MKWLKKFVWCSPSGGPAVVMYVGRDSLTANLAGPSKTYLKNENYFVWGDIFGYYGNVICAFRKVQSSHIFRVFWKAKTCRLVNSYRHYGGANAHHIRELAAKERYRLWVNIVAELKMTCCLESFTRQELLLLILLAIHLQEIQTGKKKQNESRVSTGVLSHTGET